jgi:protein CpxP
MKSKFTPRILVAALILALGAGGAAFAMSPERCGAPGGRMEHRMQYHMKEMSRLHDDLKLDARQDALWQDAEQFSRTSMREMGEQMAQAPRGSPGQRQQTGCRPARRRQADG